MSDKEYYLGLAFIWLVLVPAIFFGLHGLLYGLIWVLKHFVG